MVLGSSSRDFPASPAAAAAAYRKKKKALRSFIHLAAMSLLSFAIGFLVSYDAATMRGDGEATGIHDATGGRRDVDASPPEGGGDRRRAHSPPSTTLELLGRISMEQRRMRDDFLPPEYGRFSSIFDSENSEMVFDVSPLSKKRLLRKLMTKILLGRVRSDGGGGDAAAPAFTWVVLGDSAAAGHGNAPSHAYASILEETAGGAFRTAGIRLVAPVRAGDAWSGMELALCLESIVGGDADALGWDFAPGVVGDPMSSGQGLDPPSFGERAGRVLPHLPFLFFVGLFADGGVLEGLSRLEAGGMGFGLMAGEALREMILTFPDYNNVKTGRNGADAVKGFRCGGHIEGKGACRAPLQCENPRSGSDCTAARYRADESCRNDGYQTPWNDGWRMHRLKGRLLGFYLAEMLRLAAVELDALEQQQPQLRVDPSQALDILRAEEEVEEFLFSKTRPSMMNGDGSSLLKSWDVLKQRNSVCLNARAASMVSSKGDLSKLALDPPRASLCEDFFPFQNVYFRIEREDGWVHAHLGESLGRSQNRPPVTLGLCFKRCYGVRCGANAVYGVDEFQIEWDRLVEVRIDGNSASTPKRIGGCHIMHTKGPPDGKPGQNLSTGVQIRNLSDRALLLSSVFLIF